MTETERSIPACAGEPSRGGPSTTSPRVYPRVCGGALRFTLDLIEVLGLSPRVRGSLGRSIGRHHTLGSIPACAGEPPEARLPTSLHRVYPRVCGGARGARRTGLPWSGLSPRVRGSRRRPRAIAVGTGSIPACAGEPSGAIPRRRRDGVYPRVCGGAVHAVRASKSARGLSPRVRGSPPVQGPAVDPAGSIPACAGEPVGCRQPSISSRVYPRVCGGARDRDKHLMLVPGLSPRVRGSPGRRLDAVAPRGSIPACAGEPDRGEAAVHPPRVYPRVCGGA